MSKRAAIKSPAPGELRKQLLDCITAGFNTTEAISRHLAIKPSVVAARLAYYKELGAVHAERIPRATGGSVNQWRLGPEIDKYGQPGQTYQPRERGRCGDARHVTIVQTYPTIGHRDPLVAALFGAPAAAQGVAP